MPFPVCIGPQLETTVGPDPSNQTENLTQSGIDPYGFTPPRKSFDRADQNARRIYRGSDYRSTAANIDGKQQDLTCFHTGHQGENSGSVRMNWGTCRTFTKQAGNSRKWLETQSIKKSYPCSLFNSFGVNPPKQIKKIIARG